jgi:type I restriction enzyme, R subunit
MRNEVAIELLRRRIAGVFSDPAVLDYEFLDAAGEQEGECTISERQRKSEVVLVPRLRKALERINENTDAKLLDKAIQEIIQDRSLSGMVGANQQIYQILKDGVKVDIGQSERKDERDNEEQKKIQVIDWEHPKNNDFLLVANFWIYGQMGNQRIGLLGFINGLPLILPELSIVNDLQEIYDGAIAEYKRNLPQLFWYNAFIIVSDGRKSKMGSLTASWEFFFEWKRIASEEEEESPTLDTLLVGTCEKERFLDIVENFTLFNQKEGSGTKIVGRNHQYLGVNAAFERIRHKEELQGKLGVFWHTQGSGKSYSMAFFAQKVQRILDGQWTFVIVTDRDELDKQIYKTFANVGAVTEPEEAVHATGWGDLNGGQHLKQLLQHEKHRTVFTLIQKFYTEDAGQVYETLSKRADVIVMVDEAHRTQYDELARHMREALPNASFIGFTGTPLIEEEEQETRTTFGPYISIYNFSQAIKDGITVPLYYENHTPAIKLTDPDFAAAMKKLAEDADLSDEQKDKLIEQSLQEGSVLVDNERLELVAQDIVEHFMQRGYMGKAMVISIDRITAGRMYAKVQKYWKRYQERIEERLKVEKDGQERKKLESTVEYMQQTEMTIVISTTQGDVQRFSSLGIDIQEHQRRMHTAAEDFKAEEKPLRIVFVCAMWMTGFDVPCLSTIYLDRPLRNHNLMQTIARANRVFKKDKTNGLIVDYVGTFNDLRDALAIYALDRDERTNDMPVGDKSELVRVLGEALNDIETFCREQGVDIQYPEQDEYPGKDSDPNQHEILEQGKREAPSMPAQTPLTSTVTLEVGGKQSKEERIQSIKDAADRLVVNDDSKLHYLALAGDVHRLYKAILPDSAEKNYEGRVHLFRQIELAIYAAMRGGSLAEIIGKAKGLIDDAIETMEYDLREAPDPYTVEGVFDLSRIDLDELAGSLKTGNTHLKAEELRGILSRKLQQMIQVNKSRVDYQNKLQQIIDDYNDRSANYATYPDELIAFTRELQEEEQRPGREQLSEEELALFDLLTRPTIQLSDEDREAVKIVARELLKDLKGGKLGLDWQKKQKERGRIQETIETILDNLPSTYTKEVYKKKCEDIYIHIQDYYKGDGSISAA